jgi:hypothetical protein
MKLGGDPNGIRNHFRDFAIPRNFAINMQQLARYSAIRKSAIPQNRAVLRTSRVRICPKEWTPSRGMGREFDGFKQELQSRGITTQERMNPGALT